MLTQKGETETNNADSLKMYTEMRRTSFLKKALTIHCTVKNISSSSGVKLLKTFHYW